MTTALSFVTGFGALQSLLIAFVLALTGDRARKLLAGLAATLAVIVGGSVALQPLMRDLPTLAKVYVPFNYLLAPLFYLFIRASLGRDTGRIWPHAIVAAVVAITLVPMSDAVFARLILLIAQSGVYVAVTLRQLAIHDPHREERRLWIGAAIMSALWLFALARAILRFSPAVIPVVVSAIAIIAAAGLMLTNHRQRPKYERSTLDDDRRERYAQRLADALERDRLFLDPALSLDRLAEKLRIPSNHVSQIVNQRFGCNFNEWVNAHRVEEAKRQLGDRRLKHLSVVAIGEAAGFRSKSAFNAAFRRLTSTTPSEFRRRTS